MRSTASPVLDKLEVPGAVLHYEVRGDGPLAVLLGAPMDATAFASLADLLSDQHTVVTTDPRGVNRSTVHDPNAESTPELRADDLSRLIAHLDTGPAVVLGSSGGAVTALALAQAHPNQVATVIVHEAPLVELLEDRNHLHARTEDYCVTYLDGDAVGAWIKFFETANIAIPGEVVAHLTTTTRHTVGSVLKAAVKARGNFDKMTTDIARDRAAAFTPAELVAQLRESATSSRRMPGSGPMDPLMDLLVHGQDIARPLRRQHPLPTDLAAPVLTYVATSRFLGGLKRLAGLRLTATDLNWAHGTGSQVTGPAQDLLLVAAGRPAGLAHLTGPGLDRLTHRLKSP